MFVNNVLLAPYSWILRFRHFLYDKGVKNVITTEVPSICVGNITVGGTGKTPFTEMLIRLFCEHPKWKGKPIAVVSRGYKRKSKGFQDVKVTGNTDLYGDEPLQIKRKFPDVMVALDKDRINACGEVIAEGADLIILDDAFQYRTLKPHVSIVLVDYNRPVFKDHLLPVGRLRDLPERIGAADIVVVTKCPSYMNEEARNGFIGKLGYKGPLFFTATAYDHFVPLYPGKGNQRYEHAPRLLLFTGIANDRPLVKHLSINYKIVRHITYSDHHRFTERDIATISQLAEHYSDAVIATTEKDAQRILDLDFIPDWMKERLFYVPVRTHFLTPEEAAQFTETLLPYLTGQQA